MARTKSNPSGASEEWIKCRMSVTSIKKEKVKEPFESTVTAKFESNTVLEDSGEVLRGKLTFEKVSPVMFEDLKKHFGGLSDLTPLSVHIRRIPGALLDDYSVDKEGD